MGRWFTAAAQSRRVRSPLLVAIAVVLAIGLLHPIKAWWVQVWVDAMLRPPGVIHFKQQPLWGLPLGGDWPGYAEFWLDPATNDVRLLRGPRAQPERSGMLWSNFAQARFDPGPGGRGRVYLDIAYDDRRPFATAGVREARLYLELAGWDAVNGSRLLTSVQRISEMIRAVVAHRGEGGGDLTPPQSLLIGAILEAGRATALTTVERVDRASLPPEMFSPAVPGGWQARIQHYYSPEQARGFTGYPIYWAGAAVGEFTAREILVSEADPSDFASAGLPYPGQKHRLGDAVYAPSDDWRAPRLYVTTRPAPTPEEKANRDHEVARGRLSIPPPHGERLQLGQYEGLLDGATLTVMIDGAEVKVSGRSREQAIEAARALRRLN